MKDQEAECPKGGVVSDRLSVAIGREPYSKRFRSRLLLQYMPSLLRFCCPFGHSSNGLGTCESPKMPPGSPLVILVKYCSCLEGEMVLHNAYRVSSTGKIDGAMANSTQLGRSFAKGRGPIR